MALRGITRFETIDYVSDADPAKSYKQEPIDADKPEVGMKEVEVIGEGATVFKVAPLDVFIMGRIYDSGSKIIQNTADEAAIATFANQTNIEATSFGLKGWENFLDDKGNPIPFRTMKRNVGGRTYDVVADDSMKVLGVRLCAELGIKIKSISEVSQAEEKN